MAYRIEITFTGDAPDDELSRARIVAGAPVFAAIDGLQKALADAGMIATVSVRSINSVPRPKKANDPLAAPHPVSLPSTDPGPRHRVAAE